MPHSSILYWADVAARELYARGARRVWAFGSFGEGFALDPNSDIDLATEGLNTAAALEIETDLSYRSPHKIDVMVMEDVTAQVRWFIRRGTLIRGDGTVLSRPEGIRQTLKDTRLDAVQDVLRAARARRVLDLGCGRGWLIERLAGDPAIEQVLGVDRDDEVLAEAQGRVPAAARQRVSFAHTLFTWRDPVFAGHDAVTAVEVIEHLDPPQLAAFADVVFDFVHPTTIVATTPNVEYNQLFGMAGVYRLPDHRFEWTRAEFNSWGGRIAERYGYAFSAQAVGPVHPVHGPPTQLACFELAP
jgi:SAM-dependent methyltransferase